MADAFVNVETHYDMLVEEGDDPVHDPPTLRQYMDRYDGESFYSALGDLAGLRVLEIGIGTGRLAARVLAQQPASLTGLDVSQKSLDKCRSNFANEERLCLAKGAFPQWQTNERYDAVYSSLTFMHIADLRKALSRVASMLTADGRAVISFANYGPLLELGSRRIRLHVHDRADIEEATRNVGLQSHLIDLRDGSTVVAWLWVAYKH